jgi:protein-S-isoprenylcysteine O-methyltransferase Ste14
MMVAKGCLILGIRRISRVIADGISTVEEKALIKTFGDSYIQYRQKTPIGIPFMGSAVDSRLKKMNTTSR